MSTSAGDVHEQWAGEHPLLFGADALASLNRLLARWSHTSLHLLCDENSLRHCGPELFAAVPALRGLSPIVLPPGEGSKSVEACAAIWAHLAERTADRKALLICLGGGVVTDLGGFVASTYKRGIGCVHLPTTLLAMVDAAIGGKTGIDVAGTKNLVGTFHPPQAVIVHVPFLRSLGKRELMNGLAEMIKHGLVRDAGHWEAIGGTALHDLTQLTPLIHRSAAIKAEVVSEDPREAGLRKLLNFGHTIGHGVEAFSWESPQRALLHGEAVAIGMIGATYLSWRTGLLDRESHDRITAQLRALYKPFELADQDSHRIVELMRNDKKNVGDGFRFTLLRAIGDGVVDVPVNAAQVLEALEHYRVG